jgi:hypothetical protein
MFPVALLFDAAGYANWTMAYLAYHGHSPEEAQFLMKFQQSVWLRFQEYRIPVIKLTEDTPRAAVCQVFEKVNTGGVVLTVFELVTATFAVENFELRPRLGISTEEDHRKASHTECCGRHFVPNCDYTFGELRAIFDKKYSSFL